MSNLVNFNNLYANLAESAYNNRPKNFPSKNNKLKESYIDYAQDHINKKTKLVETKGGTHLPNNGIVYLQPDKTLHTEEVKTTLQVPNPNGGYHKESYVTSRYQKGLLTDEKAGFNAYFVTDSPTLSQETKQTYLAIRGSDGFGLNTLNDWVGNDANFALTNAYIPQAKLANQALVGKIKDIKRAAPNATLDVTGHSLGTMVSAQAVAKLYQDNAKAFEKIGRVVLFDGPDGTQSLKQMGLSDKEIKAVGEKVTYYVNPFDMVSMLNRTAPYEAQFGKVNVIVPLNFSTTFDGATSSHDFGEFQIDAYGNPLSASETFHPEMLTAGRKLAKLLDTTFSKVGATGIKRVATGVILAALSGGVGALMALGMSALDAKAIYDAFNKAYKGIVAEAKQKESAWNQTHIPDYQNRIRRASGGQKIELRAELLQSVAQDAVFQSEAFVSEVKTIMNQGLETVQKEIQSGHQAAHNLATYLDSWEVNALLAEFNLSAFWDSGLESDTTRAAKAYLREMSSVSATLMQVSQHIEAVDTEGASGFNQLMAETQANFGRR
ncbi:alpha/beta hydrolase [Lactococcus piscium]|uniref:DUF2974 domain-containing protein n=1 Tax=Pseudolactococcus carnosus TaxID=2749961 RepID=UPI001FB8AB52|nr:DUF2974 domain-containing protein [Lactococcus carnosus]MCJ1995231.1 alpha/beta hydrolase [Lactococcus carnosus]